MKLAVVGAGYVGLSVAALLACEETVYVVDVVQEKIGLIRAGVSPIRDDGLAAWLHERNLDLHPTLDAPLAYDGARFVVVAVPTSFDDETNKFDTSAVESVIEQVVEVNPQATIVVKSTIPVGYTDSLCERYPQGRFLFSPEFLREGHALDDNAHPSRVIVGIPSARKDDKKLVRDAEEFAALLARASLDDDVPTFVMSAQEAESVKLFANTYLATRVAFFNELDTFAMSKGLDTAKIVAGVCADPRIGGHYNNPSFGYGGYCLPKDSKQLLANYAFVPQNLIGAVVASNATRKEAVVQDILAHVRELASAGSCHGWASSGLKETGDASPSPDGAGCIGASAAFDAEDARCEEAFAKPAGCADIPVGIYRLITKAESDNFRSTAIADVMMRLREEGVLLCVYEPYCDAEEYQGVPVTHDFAAFKHDSALILANRMDESLRDVAHKVYTRDLFGRD